MIPDATSMIRCAEILEMTGHQLGWDNVPPVLGLIVSDGSAYRSALFPDQPRELAEDSIEGLMMLADALFRSTEKIRRRVKEAHGGDWGIPTAGVFFVFEGWTSSVDEDGMPVGDKRETRTCVILDCAGRMHVAHRTRGEKPTSRTLDPRAPKELQAFGAIVDALRRILLALGQTMPDDAIDMEAVAAVSGADPFTP